MRPRGLVPGAHGCAVSWRKPRRHELWTAGDDSPLYVGTSNHDGRGEPADGDDRIMIIE